MTVRGDVQRVSHEVLYAEAECLDERRWDDWLALYTSDCTFWVPSWISDADMCTDPSREISLIYYTSRTGLEERVTRIRSGRSIASMPMPRTAHSITNISSRELDEAHIVAKSVWAVDLYSVKARASQRFFGRYEHRLVLAGGAWKISSKKVTLLNDYLPSSLDIYCI